MKPLMCDLCDKRIETPHRYDSWFRLLFRRRLKTIRWQNDGAWPELVNRSDRVWDLHEDCYSRIMRSARDHMVRVNLDLWWKEASRVLTEEADKIIGVKYGNPSFNVIGPERNKAVMRDVLEVINQMKRDLLFVKEG